MNKLKVAVLKKKDDPMAIRISIGGLKQAGENAYITYRGNLAEVQHLLLEVAKGFAELKEEAPLYDDMGNKYA